jgi:hypothetical protein
MTSTEEKEKWQIIQEQVHSMTPEEIKDLDIDWVQKSFLISLKLRQLGDEKRVLQRILDEYKDT